MASFKTRRLRAVDMAAAAQVHRLSFDECMPWLAGLHTPQEDCRFWSGHLFAFCTIWGAELAGRLVGVIAYREDWVEQLYVLPQAQGQGVGSSLLEMAKADQPQLSLWTFQRNTQARQFYEARGFVPVKETDGAGSEEKEPDVLYHWARET